MMSGKNVSKRLARLAAAQVMYQIEMTNSDLDKVVANFEEDCIKEDAQYREIDIEFFRCLVGRLNGDFDVEGIIRTHLEAGRKIEYMSSIALSILKVGIIEAAFERTAIPVIINEYIEIAKSFVDEQGVKFINAILDKATKQIRSS
jgi:N utilization substance protein B